MMQESPYLGRIAALVCFVISILIIRFTPPRHDPIVQNQAQQQPQPRPRLRKASPTLPSPSAQLIRNLTWGQVQFLHTTDIHGWFTPHHSDSAPSDSFGADWGHWVDFIRQMKDKAHQQGKDLIVVDTGDLVTGHGLSDANPTQVRGHCSNGIFAKADYDILTIGNHELYSIEGVQDMQHSFIPLFNGRYLTSNVNISLTANDSSSSSPIGSLYHTSILPQTNLRVTSLGFLFDFASPHPGQVNIQPPIQMLRSQWFKDLAQSAIARETDIWLLAGHMPLDGDEDEWNDVIAEMRKWDDIKDKTIVALAGHTHIRNCRQIDDKTMVLQSGRFHETAGFVSLNMSAQGTTFSRRYIDLNPRNLAHHLGVPVANLTTPHGQAVRSYMSDLTEEWDLNHVHGIAPRDWYLDKVDSSHPQSILQGVRDVLRRLFVDERGKSESGLLVLLNSGSMRSDIKAGPFTTNDQYIVSPFSDSFYVLPSIPRSLAARVLPRLNEGQEGGTGNESRSEAYRAHDRMLFSQIYPIASVSANEDDSGPSDNAPPSEGYVTRDECGSGLDGDDTMHTDIPVRPFEPPYVGFLAEPKHNGEEGDRPTDIITVKYLLPRVIDLLNEFGAQGGLQWNTSDAHVYNDSHGIEIKTRELWKREAQDMWEQPSGDVWL